MGTLYNISVYQHSNDLWTSSLPQQGETEWNDRTQTEQQKAPYFPSELTM